MNRHRMNLKPKGRMAGLFVMTVATALLASCGGGSEESSHAATASAWTAPVLLSSLDSDADGPRLGADGSGNVAVLWSQYDDTQATPQYRVWMNYWRSGKGWLGSNSIDSGNRRDPVFTLGADGRNRAVWSTATGDQLLYTEFQVNEGNNGPGSYDTSWNHPRSTFVSGTGLGNPQVLSYGSNQTLMVYTVSGSPTVVKASVGGGGGVSSSSTVQLSGVSAASLPQLVRLPNDNALAVWCENGLLTSRRFDGSTWASAVQNADGCVDLNLRLAVSADGSKVVAAGQRNYKGELHVWRYDTGTNAWSDAGSGGLPYPKATTPPAIGVDNAGHILLAWVSYDVNTSRSSLMASVGTRSYILGVLQPINGWSEPVRLDDTARGNVASPQLALDSLGNAYAVWTQYGSGGWDVLARHFNASTFTLGSIESLENDAGAAYKPQLLFDSNDKAVVAWGFVSGISGDSHSGIRAVRHQ